MTPASDFLAFSIGALCNASPTVRPLSAAIKPLEREHRVAGRARTARTPPGQNAAIHRAVHLAQPGEILVVEAGGASRFGPFGDILAACCQQRGMAGAVLDGSVRDAADLRALGFPVFCRGLHPEPTAKTEPGAVDVEINCGGARVRPGDYIVGDEDGVVVIPFEEADAVRAQAAQVLEREAEIRARMAAGETTFEIFKLGAG